MKIVAFFNYIIRSISYGVLLGVIILITVPELRSQLALTSLFNPQTQTQKPISFAKAVRLAGPAVVNLYSSEISPTPRYGQYTRKSTRLGSGVIMDTKGYILSNFHVVQDADVIEVFLQDGQRYAAELIGYDIYTDLAVLKVNAKNLPVIPQKIDLDSFAGDVVLAIGNPFNLGQTVTQGIVSATGRSGLSSTNYSEFLQMDAAINAGNSGGALVNSNGVLVGINSFKFTLLNPQLNSQGIFFAVPYELAYKVMRKIIENGRVIRGYLGVSSTRYSVDAKGFYIDNVTSESPADDAGLVPGDIVIQIADWPIHSIEQALDIVAETLPGTTLTFKLYRNKQIIEVPVTIRELRTELDGRS